MPTKALVDPKVVHWWSTSKREFAILGKVAKKERVAP
jgi:hypothetical protein